jgi:hypothetical protein
MKRHSSVQIEVTFNTSAASLKNALDKIPDNAEVDVIRGYDGNQFDSEPDKIKFSWDEEL